MAIQTWEEMRDRCIGILERRTGEGLDEWNRRVRESGVEDEAALRTWLTERDVTGYAQMLLVMERFGYPDFLSASADELIDGQYTDRPALRPILDRLIVVGTSLGELGEVGVQARKTYVTLTTPRRKFALIRATTRTRVDLGLRLPGRAPGGRLLAATSIGDDVMTVRIGITAPDEVDDEVVDLLRETYVANSSV